MGIIGYFQNPNSYTSDEFLKRDLNEINKISEKNLSFLSEKEISRLFFLHERSALSLRRYLEEKESEGEVNLLDFEEKERAFPQKNRELFLDNLPILIEKKKDIIHIHAPYTFNKGMKEGFNVANYINAEMKKKEKEGMSFLSKNKVAIVIVRSGKRQNSKWYCDNDNFETKRIINVIFEHLGMSDNVLNMSCMSDFVPSDNEASFGMHLFIVPYSINLFSGEKLFKLFGIQTRQ